LANGQVLRGRHNQAGEIGGLLMSREQLRAEPGTVSGVESVASGPALARRAVELLASGRESSMSADRLTAHAVFEAARDEDPVALEVIEELLDYVAITVIDLAAVLDPERVIFDGSVGRALEPYVAGLEERIAWRLPHVPAVHFSRLPNATVIGAMAGALALDREVDARRTIAEIPDDGLCVLATLPSYGVPLDRGTKQVSEEAANEGTSEG
jgi:glucokinase